MLFFFYIPWYSQAVLDYLHWRMYLFILFLLTLFQKLSGQALSMKSILITNSKQVWFLREKVILPKLVFLLLKCQWNENPRQCQEGCHYVHRRAGLTRHLSGMDASADASSKADWQILLAQSWNTMVQLGVKAVPSQTFGLLKPWNRTERQTQSLSRSFSG